MSKKILISPIEIAGYYKNLEKGFNDIGVNAVFYSYNSNNFYNNQISKNNKLIYLINKCYHLKKSNNITIKNILLMLVIEIFKFLFFLYAVLEFDVFIFGYGKSLLFKNYDLPFLKFFGKRIIMNIAHGSELRPPYIDGSYQSKDGLIQPSKVFLKKETLRIFKKAKYLEKNCDVLIGSPMSSSFFLQRKFINSFCLGIPFHDKKLNTEYVNFNSRIRILHSPSNEAVKGTKYIRQAIQNLKKRGLDFDYIEVKNQPNEVVLNEISKCTFVIDQIFSDTPLAGFATEAAWFKKAAIVGGYGLEEIRKYIDKNEFPPSLTCLPNEIEDCIFEMISNSDTRDKIANEAYNFVHTKWNYKNVALKYIDIVNGVYDKNWEFNPLLNNYILGVGQPKETTINNVKNLILEYGLKSLCLYEKQNIENKFLKLALQEEPYYV